jgi:steroid delta-isomerase-like uncharacterized protein
MSAQTNQTLARTIVDAFNARKFDEATKHVTDKFVWRNVPTGETFTGPAGMRKYFENWVNGFKDARVDIKQIISTEKNVVLEYVGSGTHTGPIETPNGQILATNHKAEIPCADICTIENGKVASITSYFDLATMMQQLGLAEPAGAHR